METITVTILNGEATVATSGFKGKACLAATAELEKALGKKTSDAPTREMTQTTAATLKVGAR